MSSRYRIWNRAAVLLTASVLSGCSATGYPIHSLAEEINATLGRSRTTAEAGDNIRVVFPYRSDWDQDARIQDDGYATFTLVGAVKVVGMTVDQLNEELVKRYNEASGSEQIELTADILSGVAQGSDSTDTSNVVYVIGDVASPGSVRLTGRQVTLIEAISAAGGHLKATANLRNTVLIRRIRGSNEMRSWRLDADVYGWGDEPAVFLQARDVVFVPNTAIDDVNIWVDQYIRKMIPVPGFGIPASAL